MRFSVFQRYPSGNMNRAMQGSYDEAIACALEAREVFLAEGDLLGAGKIEQNLGNIYIDAISTLKQSGSCVWRASVSLP